MKWLGKKFDTVTFNDSMYWNLSDIACFIDSDLGNDSTGDGTATAPWKTISKAKSAGATYWAAGKKIMINGVFDESLSINTAVTIIGVGGANGRAVFKAAVSCASSASLQNILLQDYISTTSFIGTYNVFLYNCVLYNVTFGNTTLYAFRNVFKDVAFGTVVFNTLDGNTFYNCTRTAVTIATNASMFNNHANTAFFTTDATKGNLANVDGLYTNPTILNFSFGTNSPLYMTGKGYNKSKHVGGGYFGRALTYADAELSTGATYTNLYVNGSVIERIDANIDGTLETGIINLTYPTSLVKLHHSITSSSGDMTAIIQSTSGATYRQGVDCIIQYGSSEQEVLDCPEILCEYGKPVTVSGTGASRIGSTHPDFDTANYYTAIFTYFKLKLTFKNNV